MAEPEIKTTEVPISISTTRAVTSLELASKFWKALVEVQAEAEQDMKVILERKADGRRSVRRMPGKSLLPAARTGPLWTAPAPAAIPSLEIDFPWNEVPRPPAPPVAPPPPAPPVPPPPPPPASGHVTPLVRTSYLSAIYDPEQAKETLRWLERALVTQRARFDGIVFRGSSGAIAMAAAVPLGIPCLHVRKDMGHSSCAVEGAWVPRLAFVDDFIDSGETLRIVEDKIRDYRPASFTLAPPRITAVFLYRKYQDGSAEVAVRRALGDMAADGIACIGRGEE